jgi:hypothetical protein
LDSSSRSKVSKEDNEVHPNQRGGNRQYITNQLSWGEHQSEKQKFGEKLSPFDNLQALLKQEQESPPPPFPLSTKKIKRSDKKAHQKLENFYLKLLAGSPYTLCVPNKKTLCHTRFGWEADFLSGVSILGNFR